MCSNHTSSRMLALALAAFCLAWTPSLCAQEPKKKIPVCEIEKLRVGFQSNDPGDMQGRFKVGMWTPIYLKLKAGPQGIRAKGPNDPSPYIQVENEDSDNVGTIYRTPFVMDPNDERWVMSYGKPGTMSDFKIQVIIGELPPFRPLLMSSGNALDLNTHLYVCLGARMPDLQDTLRAMSPRKGQDFGPGGQRGDTWPRYAGFENEVSELPENWFGYQGVDLLLLSTKDRQFLEELAKPNDASQARLRAIAQYVRRGGRLVVSIAPRHADLLVQLLQSKMWQPALPAVPTKEAIDLRAPLERFTKDAGVRFGELRAVVLEPAKIMPGVWDVLLAAGEEGDPSAKPLIARMPYGLGSITFMAFSLDEPPFTTWDPRGRRAFMEQLVTKLGPRLSSQVDFNEQRNNFDLATDLQKSLDNFDVRVIPFGYVALFIILYILVVGPLDFLVLKYIVKRLEWTWFTFPTVVIAVSVAAYYTAYAIKGNELKINKVDIVDFDLRTDLDAKGQLRKASIYGQTFFTILSPQIKNYTVGVEGNANFWGQEQDKRAAADMVTWFGRADNMFGGMQRGGGQGFFRKPYRYEADATGLLDVPIPVWTTKTFHAAWEAVNVAPPFQAQLVYHQQQDKEMVLTGTLKSGLAVDLEDAWLLYFENAFPLEAGLPKGSEIKIQLNRAKARSISKEWASGNDGERVQTAQGGAYNPGSIVRKILFNDKVDQSNTSRNHALRPLDLSWRLPQEPLALGRRDQRVREAILVARVKFALGDARALSTDVNQPLPTQLWLDRLPGDPSGPSPLSGVLAQDTFVRVILPVKPKE